jgi:hypothetical protein
VTKKKSKRTKFQSTPNHNSPVPLVSLRLLTRTVHTFHSPLTTLKRLVSPKIKKFKNRRRKKKFEG